MPEVNNREIAEPGRPKGFRPLPEIDVFATPSDEVLIQTSDGHISFTGDGYAPSMQILDDGLAVLGKAQLGPG